MYAIHNGSITIVYFRKHDSLSFFCTKSCLFGGIYMYKLMYSQTSKASILVDVMALYPSNSLVSIRT